jgi:hypothetical protein
MQTETIEITGLPLGTITALEELVRSRGKSVEDYLRDLIQTDILSASRDWQSDIALMAADPQIQAELRAIEREFAVTEDEKPLYETATPEELAQAFLAWANSHNHNSPGLTLEDVSRESIYEDR